LSGVGAGRSVTVMETETRTHSTVVGYLLWIFGFTGAHRFYFGKTVSGVIWFFTAGLCGIGWLIDVFLIPGMNQKASLRFNTGPIDYTVGWILLTFLGFFGAHRFYLRKWGTAIIYLLTAGLLGIGILYDFLTLNSQISEQNASAGN
jgi:TM2 domain-containing membrane protein YozV